MIAKSDRVFKYLIETNLLLIGFFLLFSSYLSFGQQRPDLDSLENILSQNELVDSLKFQALKYLAFYNNDPHVGVKYANKLITLATDKGNEEYIYHGYIQKGYKLQHLGEYEKALKCFFESTKHTSTFDKPEAEATAYGSIADIYSFLNNHPNAIRYYQQALRLLNQTTETAVLAGIYLNAGDEYLKHGDYDSALVYFDQSEKIYQNLNNQRGIAYNLGNIGMTYANQGRTDLAKNNMEQAIDILQEMKDYYPVCFYLLSISDIFQKTDNTPEAIYYAEMSLSLANEYGLKQQISDAHLKLSDIYEASNNNKLSLKHFKEHIAYRDSVTNLKTVQQIADQRTEFEVNLRESEINALEKDKKLQQTYVIIAIILAVLLLIIMLFFRQRYRTAQLRMKVARKENDDKIHDLLRTHETDTLQAMVVGKEEERKHLAKEIHNHLGSILATIKVNLNGLKSENASKHQTITELVDQACTDVRNISHELNMGVAENFGLVPAVAELVRHLKKVKGLIVEFSSSLEIVQLDSKSEILLYRIIQELISNVLKHARATELSVSLTGFEENNMVNILVEDNGIGIKPKNMNKPSDGIGLGSLKGLVQKMDGQIDIDSREESGTTVSIDLPFNRPKTTLEP